MIEKHWSYVAVMLKTKCKSISLENPLATGGCLEHNIYRVTPLAWLKEEDEQF